MNLPLVSCIMPTANREKYIPYAIRYFLDQNYPNKELVIVDDGHTSVAPFIPEKDTISYFYSAPIGTIGLKRNYACEKAKGEIIVNWDDDDWYAPDWISYQVVSLLSSGADIAGLNQVQYWSPLLKTCWITKNSDTSYPWLSGQSLIYRKTFWQEHPFQDRQTESDDEFVGLNGVKLFAHDYYQGLLVMLHGHNTTQKFFEDPRIKKFA